MVRTYIILIVLALCLMAPLAFAQQSDVHFAVGLRYQLGSWQVKDIYYYDSEDALVNGDTTELGSEVGHMYGPMISISYQKFAVSFNYMMGSWEFPKQYLFIWTPLGWDYDFAINTPTRNEMIVTLSYRVAPRIQVFVGYKYLTLKEKFEYDYYTEFDFEIENKGSGFGGGISASAPFSPTIHGYGTLGYMSIGGDFEGWGNLIAEGGIRLYLKNSPLYGAVGYRYEAFSESDTMNDAALHGPILTISYYK